MSRRIGNVTILEETPPAKCDLCGKIEELRPYGPQGENICFDCAMKDEVGTERRMRKILFGENRQ